jgi:hypothetical protein
MISRRDGKISLFGGYATASFSASFSLSSFHDSAPKPLIWQRLPRGPAARFRGSRHNPSFFRDAIEDIYSRDIFPSIQKDESKLRPAPHT